MATSSFDKEIYVDNKHIKKFLEKMNNPVNVEIFDTNYEADNKKGIKLLRKLIANQKEKP